MGIVIGVVVVVIIIIAVILLKNFLDKETKRNLSKLGKLFLILFGAMILVGIFVIVSQR